EITLTRTSTEKIFVLLGGLVFLALSFVIFITLVKSTVLKRFEELLAIAGYLVAATGFRDLLGISREAGVSAFEVIVLGFRFFLLPLELVYRWFEVSRPSLSAGNLASCRPTPRCSRQ